MRILELSKIAQAYYESLMAPGLLQGWEKLVATDGCQCCFVHSDYRPNPGEAVFYLCVKNKCVLCELKRSNLKGTGLSWRREKGLMWSIRHDDTKSVIRFIEGCYWETKAWFDPDGLLDWLAPTKKDEINKMFDAWIRETEGLRYLGECQVQERRRAIKSMNDVNCLVEAALALRDTFESYEAYSLGVSRVLEELDGASRELVQTIDDMNGMVVAELVLLINAYWLSPYDIQQWAQDCFEWAKTVELPDEGNVEL